MTNNCTGLVCCILIGSGCVCAQEAGGKLTIYMAGKPVASESYSIQKPDGKVELSGTGKAELGSLKVSIDEFRVVTDNQFQPVSASAKAMMGQMKMEDAVAFVDGKAKNEINTGQGAQPKEDAVHPDALVVNSNLPLFAWSLLALRANLETKDPQTFYAYIIGQAEVPVTVVFKGSESVEFADRSAQLNHLSMTFPPSATAKPINVDFWLDDQRKIIKVAVPSQSVEAYQGGFEPKAPPPAAAPKPDPK